MPLVTRKTPRAAYQKNHLTHTPASLRRWPTDRSIWRSCECCVDAACWPNGPKELRSGSRLMPHRKSARRPRPARIGAPSLSRTCHWLTPPSAWDECSRWWDCCPNWHAVGRPRWISNASAVSKLRRRKPLFGSRQAMVVADRWDGVPEMLRAC